MQRPGLAVEQVFKRTRVRVEDKTNGKQTPWEESSLRGDFYFKPKKPEVPTVQETESHADKEMLFWQSVKDTNDPGLLKTYVDRYPDGTFAGLAAAMIERLRRKVNHAEKLKKQKAQKDREADILRKLEEERLARQKAERDLEIAESQKQEQRENIALLTPPAPDTNLPQSMSPQEMTALGRRYETGEGVTKDISKAVGLYESASAKGQMEARYRLSLLYYEGLGVENDYQTAATLMLEVIEAKHGPAVDVLVDSNRLRSHQFLQNLQRKLKARGLYRGRIDGRWGSGSRKAVLALAGRVAPPSEPGSNQAADRNKNKAAKKPKKAAAGVKVSCGGITFMSACVGAPQCHWVPNNHDRKCIPRNVVNSGAQE